MRRVARFAFSSRFRKVFNRYSVVSRRHIDTSRRSVSHPLQCTIGERPTRQCICRSPICATRRHRHRSGDGNAFRYRRRTRGFLRRSNTCRDTDATRCVKHAHSTFAPRTAPSRRERHRREYDRSDECWGALCHGWRYRKDFCRNTSPIWRQF